MKLLIKKLDKQARLPQYAHSGDAGLDIFCNEEYILKPQERHLFTTGIQIAIPDGCVGLIWDKSGLAVNNAIKTMAGVIDEGYRGELKILLVNLSAIDFRFEKYTKIAQLIIQKKESVDIQETDNLDDTSRGKNGFGSTGLK
jgi:dUTP pyrophosphatase